MTREPAPTAADPTADITADITAGITVAEAAVVVRAEEQLRVSTVTRVRERVRLRKRVVTEEVTRTITVAREILDIQHLPADPSREVSAAAAGLPGPVELDLVLHEERVVVTTEVVPVERVRVRVHQITEQIEVAEVLRREQVDVAPA